MHLLLLLLSVLLQPPSDVPQTPADIAAQAASAYEAGNYTRAVTLYEQLAESGVHASSVYFNLGNAHYESGQLGKALLWYRRAQRLAPRDEEINANLARTRAERVDFQGNASVLIDQIAESTYAVATRDELQLITTAAWIIWFSIVTAWIAVKRLRRQLIPWIIGAGGILALLLIVYGARLYVDENRPLAVVTDLSAEVMSGPGEDYLMLYTLYSAAEMRLIDQRGNWARIILPDGRQGWINAADIEQV